LYRFSLVVFFPGPLPSTKKAVVIAYLLVLIIVLGPIIFAASFQSGGGSSSGYNFFDGRDYIMGAIAVGHMYFLVPLTSLLAMVAPIPQAREIRSRFSDMALSITGLRTQAIIFAAVGVGWVLRIPLGKDWLRDLLFWYPIFAVDSIIFAAVQARLWHIAVRCHDLGSTYLDCEVAPLMG
jgi:hypothetical protein